MEKPIVDNLDIHLGHVSNPPPIVSNEFRYMLVTVSNAPARTDRTRQSAAGFAGSAAASSSHLRKDRSPPDAWGALLAAPREPASSLGRGRVASTHQRHRRTFPPETALAAREAQLSTVPRPAPSPFPSS